MLIKKTTKVFARVEILTLSHDQNPLQASTFCLPQITLQLKLDILLISSPKLWYTVAVRKWGQIFNGCKLAEIY